MKKKQFVKIYLASVSIRIGLNFLFSVSFCSLMTFFIQMEILPQISFFTDLFGRCGELTEAGGDWKLLRKHFGFTEIHVTLEDTPN